MIRYRSSRIVPGVKPPTGIESDEINGLFEQQAPVQPRSPKPSAFVKRNSPRFHTRDKNGFREESRRHRTGTALAGASAKHSHTVRNVPQRYQSVRRFSVPAIFSRCYITFLESGVFMQRKVSVICSIAVISAVLAVSGQSVTRQPQAGTATLANVAAEKALIDQYCVTCHSEKAKMPVVKCQRRRAS